MRELAVWLPMARVVTGLGALADVYGVDLAGAGVGVAYDLDIAGAVGEQIILVATEVLISHHAR